MLRNLFFIALILLAAPSFAGPGLIQYQGRLTDPAGNPITTPVSITFTFWSAAAGGTQLGGTYNDTDTVTPNSQGLYSTMIGDETGTKIPDAIFTSPQVWLNVRIGSENLSPRKQLVAVAYAFQSNYATTATIAVESKDTLASVTNRGATTSKELTLSGGAKAGRISSLTPGGSVQVEGVYMVGGSVALPAISPPASSTNKIYFSNGSLYWQGTPVLLARGENYIVVQTTSNPVTNGDNLVSAYNYAKTLHPNGRVLESSNRFAVLLPPGNYQLSPHQFTMDAEFVDLIGMSTARGDQYIFDRNEYSGGWVVGQTANDVRIENLTITATCTEHFAVAPVAYFPESNRPKTVIRNCEFIGISHANSMRQGIEYSGRYEDCAAGYFSFGYLGPASGTFIRCSAGSDSFGSHGAASGNFTECHGALFCFGSEAEASGTFIRCTCDEYGFGVNGKASGTFIDCVSGYGSFGYNADAVGTFKNCTATGRSFGWDGKATGTFENCSADYESFGTHGIAGGKFINCRANDYSFGYHGIASGVFTNCIADDNSFGSGNESQQGIASGTFMNCKGDERCFGASVYVDVGTTVSVCSGTFVNCVGGQRSFGGDYSMTTGIKLQGCRMQGPQWEGSLAGTMENCHWIGHVYCSSLARIYGSTIVGTINMYNLAAGVTQTRAKSIINDASNIFGATNAAAFNIENGSVQ